MKKSITNVAPILVAALAGTSMATAQETKNEKPATGTALMQAVAAYSSATDSLSVGLKNVYDAKSNEERNSSLTAPLERLTFILANGDEVESELADTKGDKVKINQVLYKLTPLDVVFESQIDIAAQDLLCSPLKKSANYKAALSPLKTAGDRMKPVSKPSDTSGLSLFFESIGSNYKLDDDLKNEKDISAVIEKTCRNDLKEAKDYLSFTSDKPGEFLNIVIGALTAINTAKKALDGPFGAIGRRIDLRKRDRALQKFIRELEPCPEYKNEECKPGVNTIRESINKIGDGLNSLVQVNRREKAVQFYVTYVQHRWALEDLTVGEYTHDHGDNKKSLQIVLGKDVKLGGKTSSEKYALARKYFESDDIKTTRKAVLEAAAEYDAAFRAGGVAASTEELELAWDKLVKNAYEPQKYKLDDAIGLFTDINAALNAPGSALDQLQKDLKALGKRPAGAGDDPKKE